MARAIWSGAVSFGLVSIPVKLFNAVSRKSVSFNQLDARTERRPVQPSQQPVAIADRELRHRSRFRGSATRRDQEAVHQPAAGRGHVRVEHELVAAGERPQHSPAPAVTSVGEIDAHRRRLRSRALP